MKSEKQATDNLALARRIRAAGRPIYIAEDDSEAPSIPSDGLRVFQSGGVMESRLSDCSIGTAIVIFLGITINLPRFAISAFDLELPWEQKQFYWLEDPLEIDGSSRCYRFDGRDLPEFDRSGVLNHCANIRRTYSPGQSIQGCLLGHAFDSIPEKYPHGITISAFVVVYDQYGQRYRSPVSLWIDRSRPRRTVSRKRNLLEHPDPIARRS